MINDIIIYADSHVVEPPNLWKERLDAPAGILIHLFVTRRVQ